MLKGDLNQPIRFTHFPINCRENQIICNAFHKSWFT